MTDRTLTHFYFFLSVSFWSECTQEEDDDVLAAVDTDDDDDCDYDDEKTDLGTELNSWLRALFPLVSYVTLWIYMSRLALLHNSRIKNGLFHKKAVTLAV